MNVADVDPCGTVTVAGTTASRTFELARLITAPPLPAGLARVTVPVVLVGPTTEFGFTEMLLNAGVTLRFEVRLTPEYDAAITTGACFGTETV